MNVATPARKPPVAARTGAGSAATRWASVIGGCSTGRTSLTSERTGSDSVKAASLLRGVAVQGLLVDTEGLNDVAAHRLHRLVHRGVRLEDPAGLAALLRPPGSRLEVLDVELRRHAGVLVLRQHAERPHAHPLDRVLRPQEPGPAEGQQATVQLGQDLVVVEDR